jgi:hypothetical protein
MKIPILSRYAPFVCHHCRRPTKMPPVFGWLPPPSDQKDHSRIRPSICVTCAVADVPWPDLTLAEAGLLMVLVATLVDAGHAAEDLRRRRP